MKQGIVPAITKPLKGKDKVYIKLERKFVTSPKRHCEYDDDVLYEPAKGYTKFDFFRRTKFGDASYKHTDSNGQAYIITIPGGIGLEPTWLSKLKRS